MEPRIWIRAFGTLDTRFSPKDKIGEWQGEREATRAQAQQEVEAWLTEHYGDDWYDTNEGKGVLPRYQNKDHLKAGQYIPVVFQVDDPHGQYVYCREDYMKKADLIAIHEAVLAGDFATASRLSQNVAAKAEAGKADIQKKRKRAYAEWEVRDLNIIEYYREH